MWFAKIGLPRNINGTIVYIHDTCVCVAVRVLVYALVLVFTSINIDRST